MTNHHRALLGLLHVPELGLRRIKHLLMTTGVSSAEQIFNIPYSRLVRIDSIGEKVAANIANFNDWSAVDKILEKTDAANASLVGYRDECYPELLKHIYDPPILLWVKGNKQVLQQDGIAIIGTRRPGRYGLNQAKKWTELLSAAGLCINSGLAYGVDTAAHKAAVNSGGKTVAVLGSGIDVIYPARNSGIAKEIIDTGGAVITEFMPGTKPDAVNFPERNRIVSGMSHGVLVVESGIKGGSMITARSALDQNREVFVLPHPLDYPGGEGCNYLIRTGQGKLVQSLQDIQEEISVQLYKERFKKSQKPAKKVWETLDLEDELQKICKELEAEDLHIDQLCENLSTPVYKLLPSLLDLEMRGAVKQKAGKYFELC
jgi:DNA processing protein